MCASVSCICFFFVAPSFFPFCSFFFVFTHEMCHKMTMLHIISMRMVFSKSMKMRWNCFSLQLHGMVRIFVDRWNAKIACYSILFHRNIIYSKCDAVSLWCRSMKLNSNQIIFAWHWVLFLFLCNMWHDSNLWNIVHSIPWCKTNVWIYKHLSISINDCTMYWEKEWMFGCCIQHTYIEKSKVFTLCVCVSVCVHGEWKPKCYKYANT